MAKCKLLTVYRILSFTVTHVSGHARAGENRGRKTVTSTPIEATGTATATPTQVSPRVVLAGAIGSVVEYYDFGVYGYVATILATNFFVSGDPAAALLATLATFAFAFVLRPVGGVLFGHFGDKYGRKNALAATVVLMAIASGLIGVLPTYAAIGVGATVLLFLARSLQGLAAGGELGGAASFVAEYSPNHRRGLLCSTTQMGALMGALLASLVVTLLFEILGAQTMNDWGWRVPFLIAIPLGVVGLWIRSRLADTPRFAAIELQEKKASAPVVSLFRTELKPLLICVGLSILLFSAYYVAYVYVNIHLQTVVKLSANVAYWSTTATLAVAVLCMPLFGMLSDRIGRKPVFPGGGRGRADRADPGVPSLRAGWRRRHRRADRAGPDRLGPDGCRVLGLRRAVHDAGSLHRDCSGLQHRSCCGRGYGAVHLHVAGRGDRLGDLTGLFPDGDCRDHPRRGEHHARDRRHCAARCMSEMTGRDE